jgi:GcrA cell cycle regulator
MTNQKSDTWTAERIAVLTRLWAEGFSASLIGEQIGVTRNAVIGKAHRLELPPSKFPKTQQSKPRAERQPRQPRSLKAPMVPVENYESVRVVRANGNSDTMKLIHSIKTDQFIPRCVEIEPRHLTLIDLEPNDCRYPYGYDVVTFCGHPKLAGSSYCVPHHHLCKEAPRVPIRRFVGSAAA